MTNKLNDILEEDEDLRVLLAGIIPFGVSNERKREIAKGEEHVTPRSFAMIYDTIMIGLYTASLYELGKCLLK